ncbi:Blue copper protein [Linum grandiflorum]
MGYGSKSVSHQNLLALMISVVAFAVTSSKGFAHKYNSYTVGGSSGWTDGVDYRTWLTSKEFHAGDKLVFSYGAGSHNVLKVSKSSYENCTIPSDQSKALITGTDTVILSKGKHYYICGYYGRCGSGQKLAVDVKG